MKVRVIGAAFVVMTMMAVTLLGSVNAASTSNGFDQFGYNYNARVYVGIADGSDRVLDGTIDGDPTYANDHLIIKWSKAWDDASFNGAPWTPDAWFTNEWNGNVPGGSGGHEIVKVIWVGPELEESPYWVDGGYPFMDEFEAIMDHYSAAGGGVWGIHCHPCGLG